MISKVEVSSEMADPTPITLNGLLPGEASIQIRDMQGLGPVKATIVTNQLASGRGADYQGSLLGFRNIVMTLGLNPNWADNETMLSLRHVLYQYFMTESWCRLRFFTDTYQPLDIEGYVESCEPNMFSQDPELVVSIICPEPDFVDPDLGTYDGTLATNISSFDLENEGSVASGIEFTLSANSTVTEHSGPFYIAIVNNRGDQRFQIDTALFISALRQLKLVTEPGNRSFVSQSPPGGIVQPPINWMWKINPGSVWPLLYPGKNTITISSHAGLSWALSYHARFGGL